MFKMMIFSCSEQLTHAWDLWCVLHDFHIHADRSIAECVVTSLRVQDMPNSYDIISYAFICVHSS